MSETADDLEGIVDETPSGPLQTRTGLLAAALRQVVPIRRDFVRVGVGAANPTAPLAQLVNNRQHRALDAFLLLLGVEPILDQTPLPAAAWARALSPESGPMIAAPAMSKTWSDLEKFALVKRNGRIKRLTNALPLREDGSGAAYSRPGRNAKGTSGYFGLPTTYWTAGWDQKLTLPAKAMMLIILSATTKRPTLDADYAQIAVRYGISERTAGRGCTELERLGLMKIHRQLVSAPRSPNGITTRHHRFLTSPLAQRDIAALRHADAAAARTKQQEQAPVLLIPPPVIPPPPPPPPPPLHADLLRSTGIPR